MQVSVCPRAGLAQGRGRAACPTPRAVFCGASLAVEGDVSTNTLGGRACAYCSQRTAMGLEKWASFPVVFPPNASLSASSCRILAELAMMLRFVVGALFPALLLAAPPPINKLALFPDKSAWCEAKNITQIVGHSGCESKSIQNRYGSALSAELDAADGHL